MARDTRCAAHFLCDYIQFAFYKDKRVTAVVRICMYVHILYVACVFAHLFFFFLCTINTDDTIARAELIQHSNYDLSIMSMILGASSAVISIS